MTIAQKWNSVLEKEYWLVIVCTNKLQYIQVEGKKSQFCD
jgi:hypothetical protein